MHKTKTLDDGYMGSGKYLKRAINKYGLENFKKEILFSLDTEEDMKEKEKELVTEEFCLRKDNYNLCVGGKGGFSYINRTINHKDRNQNIANNRDYSATNWNTEKRRLARESRVYPIRRIGPGTFTGKSHTEEWKVNHSKIMKGKSKGVKNSQYGSMWITNGTISKKIKAVDSIPEGFYKGRKINSQIRKELRDGY